MPANASADPLAAVDDPLDNAAKAAFWLLQPTEWLDGHPPIEHLRRHRSEPVIELARQLSLLP